MMGDEDDLRTEREVLEEIEVAIRDLMPSEYDLVVGCRRQLLDVIGPLPTTPGIVGDGAHRRVGVGRGRRLQPPGG